MDTPLLLIVWRRPHTLRQVIDAIRPVAPTRLFVACDGPNVERPGEAEKVSATRQVIDQEIDWPCQIKRLYSDMNQGCRLGVSRAITWFFEQVEEGIILEDDCVPHPDFFPYCATLLERYRSDYRVASIGGHNPVLQISRSTDVIFSSYFECWGWATWRRAWSMYDDNMNILNVDQRASRINNMFWTVEEAEHWANLARQLLDTDSPSSWAYRFLLCSRAHNTVHAISLESLVRNIGFDADATNCMPSDDILEIPGNHLNPMLHLRTSFLAFSTEPTTLPDREFDLAYAALHGIRIKSTLKLRVICKLKKLLKSNSFALPLLSHFDASAHRHPFTHKSQHD